MLASTFARAQSSDTPDRSDAAAIGSTLSSDLLRNLPSSNNLFQLLETVEGEVISDRFYDGGLNTGRPARDGAFLSSWRQTQYFVDDVNVTVPEGGVAFLFPVLAPWDHIDVGTGLMPLGMNAPGLAVSFTPLKPAAKWTTTIEASGAPPSFVASPSTHIAPPIEALKQWTHGNLLISGPLSPRTGLVAVADWSGERQVERGAASEASGQAASGFAHVVFTPNTNEEIRTIGWFQWTQAPSTTVGTLYGPNATSRTSTGHIQSTWERRSVQEVQWRVFGAYSQSNSEPTAILGGTIDRLLDGPVPVFVDSGNRTDRQWTAGFRAINPLRRRRHRLFAGADVGRLSAQIAPGYAGVIGETLDGAIARVWTYSHAAFDSHRHATTVSAFVSDRIGLGPGREFEAGVSYDGVEGSADGAAQGISWHNVLPRLSLRWKQGESSHVTWIAGYRRAVDRLTFDTLAVGDPAGETAQASNGINLSQTVSRVGPGTGGDPNFSRIDPSLARPTTDEVVAGIEVQLTPHIRGRITGIAKRVHHLFNVVDVGAPLSSYTVSNVVDGRPAADGGDVLLPVYSRIPSTFGADRYLLTNNSSDDTARFEGLVLNGEASVGQLTLMLNATASQTDGPATNRGFHADENDIGGVGELFANPNATPSASGRLFYDRAFTLKLTGVYRFPHDVLFAAIARYQDGQPFSRMTVVPGATSSFQPAQGTEFVRAYPAGDARFMYTGTLDVRLQKQIKAGRATVDVFVDGYNVINMGNEVEERIVTGPGFRDITAIQPPAAVHVGLRLHF